MNTILAVCGVAVVVIFAYTYFTLLRDIDALEGYVDALLEDLISTAEVVQELRASVDMLHRRFDAHRIERIREHLREEATSFEN